MDKATRELLEEFFTSYFSPYDVQTIDGEIIGNIDLYQIQAQMVSETFSLLAAWWQSKMNWIVGVFANATSVGDAVNTILNELEKDPEDGGIGGPPPPSGGG